MTANVNQDTCEECMKLGMDGSEATRQVRRVESEVNEQIKSGEVSMETSAIVSHWHTTILAMTANVNQDTCEECMKLGMDGYVAKPFEEEQLYSTETCFSESG
nr:histidine kinase 2-like [Tanacetum cinerariifolium]